MPDLIIDERRGVIDIASQDADKAGIGLNSDLLKFIDSVIEEIVPTSNKSFVIDGYSSSLMGFDFADAATLRTAREKFAEYLVENGVNEELAEQEAHGLNRSWEFATYEFCPTKEGDDEPEKENGENLKDFTCVYCGIRRYHLPGQHDQCDHSVTGECSGEESKITPEQTATLFKTGDLSELSKSTLGKYTGNFSISLNEYHRVSEADRLEAWSEKQRAAIETATKDIDAALANSKTNVALTVYRGIQLEPEDLGKLRKGDIFVDQAFVSTSRRRSVAENFARSGVLVEVKIPQGSSALNARPFSREHQEEDEILLPRNARFRISDLRAVGNKHILKLEMING